jgi:DnaJ family protein C protein 19
MLIRLLLICALIFVLIVLIQQFSRGPASRKKIPGWQLALGVIALMLIVLAATGRIHWIGALLATVFAFFRQLIPLVIKWFPALRHLYQQYKHQSTQQSRQGQSQSEFTRNPQNNMKRKEALDILGLNENASREEIIMAHRKLMQKVHPDRGGSAELAARVNQAKDILLG